MVWAAGQPDLGVRGQVWPAEFVTLRGQLPVAWGNEAVVPGTVLGVVPLHPPGLPALAGHGLGAGACAAEVCEGQEVGREDQGGE
jgi:hypothetical protein